MHAAPGADTSGDPRVRGPSDLTTPMRFFAVLCAFLTFVAAYLTYAVLGLALIPQDSSVPATGEWGYALVPGVCAVALGALTVALWRNAD
jgi:hypothetical protein